MHYYIKFLSQNTDFVTLNKLGKKDNKEELLARYPMMADTVIYALRDTTNPAIRTKLEQKFESYGYTYEMYLEDKANDVGGAATDKPVFNIPMVYRLDGGDFVVEVPYDSIRYKEAYPITFVTPLPMFGAAGATDECSKEKQHNHCRFQSLKRLRKEQREAPISC